VAKETKQADLGGGTASQRGRKPLSGTTRKRCFQALKNRKGGRLWQRVPSVGIVQKTTLFKEAKNRQGGVWFHILFRGMKPRLTVANPNQQGKGE